MGKKASKMKETITEESGILGGRERFRNVGNEKSRNQNIKHKGKHHH